MQNQHVQFRHTPELTQELQKRVNDGIGTGLVARRDLERYYGLLAAGRREVASAGFSVAELAAIAAAVNGTLWEPSTVLFLADEVNEAGAATHLDDGARAHLVARLQKLSPAALFAIVDGMERWWSAPQQAADAAAFAAAGLVASN